MLQSLKGALRQLLVSAPARAHNYQRKFGQRFPCPKEDGERNDTSEPRDEEKRKPETILKVMLSTAATGMLEDMAGKELDRKRDCQ